jgi:hypothetical protein
MLQKEQGNTKKNNFKAAPDYQNVLIEFGYPAVLDLLFVRPFCMYWLPILATR